MIAVVFIGFVVVSGSDVVDCVVGDVVGIVVDVIEGVVLAVVVGVVVNGMAVVDAG